MLGVKEEGMRSKECIGLNSHAVNEMSVLFFDLYLLFNQGCFSYLTSRFKNLLCQLNIKLRWYKLLFGLKIQFNKGEYAENPH